MIRPARFLATLAFSACILAPPAFGQAPPDEAPGIPGYSIARIKVLAGSVWVRSSEGGDWDEATTNTPLAPRGRVSVPEGSEAELQFHGGQFVLLTGGTDLEAWEMDEGKTTFRLRAGEIRFDLPEDDFAPVSVRIPGGRRARFPEPGRYWLTVIDAGTTRLVVRRGTATVTHEGGQYGLSSGEEATIGSQVTIGQYQGGAAPEPPPPTLSDAARNSGVPPVAAYELQEYGEWVLAPTYGYVWRPRVAVGWSPYVYGRWVWVAPYGWTWVSYEPWGWYPYHSGYWVTDPAYGWVWAPYNAFVSVGIVYGSSYRHYYYRNFRYVPCNVRFIPEGRNVRWVPLRPGERYLRPGVQRGDPRLSTWNRPLPTGRVFVRGGSGAQQRVWRDVTVVHAERQQAVRAAPTGGPRRDLRTVRPESSARPPVTGGAVRTSPAQPVRRPPVAVPAPGNGRGVERAPATPRGGIPAPGSVRGAEPPHDGTHTPDVPRTTPRAETPREPAPRTTAPRVATPPRESAPARPEVQYVPVSPRTEPPRETAPRTTAPRVVTPPMESAPAPPEVRDVPGTPRGGAPAERAPAVRMPDTGTGGWDRGGGGGGGFRGGGSDRGDVRYR